VGIVKAVARWEHGWFYDNYEEDKLVLTVYIIMSMREMVDS